MYIAQVSGERLQDYCSSIFYFQANGLVLLQTHVKLNMHDI